MSRDPASTPAARRPEEAFVVRFRPSADPSPDVVVGRIEHVASGDTVRFESFDAMVAFIRRLLAAGVVP